MMSSLVISSFVLKEFLSSDHTLLRGIFLHFITLSSHCSFISQDSRAFRYKDSVARNLHSRFDSCQVSAFQIIKVDLNFSSFSLNSDDIFRVIKFIKSNELRFFLIIIDWCDHRNDSNSHNNGSSFNPSSWSMIFFKNHVDNDWNDSSTD